MTGFKQRCRNGSTCYYMKMGSCWFQHDKAVSREELEIKKEEKMILNKGNGWFQYNSGKEIEKEEKTILNKWEDWQSIEPRKFGVVVDNISFHADYDEEQEESEDSENSETEDEEEIVHCGCSQNMAFDPLLEQIFSLPPELRVKIFRMLDVERLLSLELSPDLLRDLLEVTVSGDLDSDAWLRMELYRQDLGIILIPDEHSLFLSNDKGWNSAYFHMYPHPGRMKFKEISPGLKPGIFKVRQLEAGFDLTRLDQEFISTQCGPRQCFPRFFNNREWDVERVGNWAWATSYISRGFTVESEDRPDLAQERFIRRNYSCRGDSCCELDYSELEDSDLEDSDPEDSGSADSEIDVFCSPYHTRGPHTKTKFDSNAQISRKSNWTDLSLMSGSIFFISLEDGWWQRRWTLTERKSYCSDDVTSALLKDDDSQQEPRLGVITSGCCDGVGHMCAACTKGGVRVVAYVLSNYGWGAEGGFCSFNPQGPLHKYTEAEMKKSDDLYEESSGFSITRYGYQDADELSGFILTGDLNYYARPAELLAQGENFPDREYY